MKNVGIVVVTYNRLSLLKEVVDSLRNQTYSDFQIIVINNGSTDGTLDWLNAQNDVLTITQANTGGAGGFYTGMKYVAEHDYKYCWVMDDDVICNPTALEELMKAYRAKEDAGFICSKVIGIDGEAMNVPILDMRKGATGYVQWYNESDYNLLRVKKSTFVSVLFSVPIIQKKGLPYREYFIWGDDWEYTQRISTEYVSYVALKSIVVHKRKIQQRINFKSEKDKARIKNYFYAYRNSAYNRIKYAEASIFRVYSGFIYRIIKTLLRGEVTHALVYMRSFSALLKFKPTVDFPAVIDR